MVATGEIMMTEHEPTIKGVMHRNVPNCPVCLRPLKPPVYEVGHVAYADCRGERQCQECDGGGGFNVHSKAVNVVLILVKVECQHKGCGLYVTYYKLDDHQSVCPFVPCKSSMPGCGYECPLPALTHHLCTVHLMLAHRIQYGKVLRLQVPVSELWHLLFTEEDDRMFFMVSGTIGMDAPIAVSFVCIRAGASPPLYYAAKVWANGPPGAPNGRTNAIELEIEVTSSKEPSAVAVEELISLTVPPKLLVGVGSSRTVSLHIRIDKLTS